LRNVKSERKSFEMRPPSEAGGVTRRKLFVRKSIADKEKNLRIKSSKPGHMLGKRLG